LPICTAWVRRLAPSLSNSRLEMGLRGVFGVADGPTCTECQIEEGDVGDYFTVGTRAVQDEHFAGIFGETLEGWSGPSADRRLLLDPPPAPGKFDPSTFRKIKDGSFEMLDSWNTVEVIWQGDRSATSSMVER